MKAFIKAFIEKYGSVGEKLLQAGVILLVGWIGMKIVNRLIHNFIKRSKGDEIILNFFHTVFRILMDAMIVIIALSQLGLDLTSVVAMFTAISAALALAVKDSLAGVVDGVKIMFAKPFSKGDYLEVDGVLGTIEEISLLYTFLMTRDNRKIVIPNSTIANTILINYSSEECRRVDLTIDVAYDSDVELVKKSILEALERDEYMRKDKEPVCMLMEYKDSAISFVVRLWSNTSEFEKCKTRALEEILSRFEETGIKIPYSQLDVFIKNEQIKHIA